MRVAVFVKPPGPVAFNVTAVVVVTVPAFTEKVVLVAPTGITTLAGTGASRLLLLLRVTANPPLGAGPSKATVTTVVAPLRMAVGDKDTELKRAGLTVTTVDRDCPLKFAVIVTGVLALTEFVRVVMFVKE